AGREKGSVSPLVVAQFVKKILGGRDRQGDQEQNTGPRKAMGRGCEKRPVQPVDDSVLAHGVLQGHTQTQPGPRKSEPTVVRMIASIKNQVMIQNENGFAVSQS